MAFHNIKPPSFHTLLYLHFILQKCGFLRAVYSPHFTLYTPHPRLHSPHFTLYTLHFALYTPHFTLYAPHFTLHTSHLSFYTLHSTLHNRHFTLYTLHSPLNTPLSSHSTLGTPTPSTFHWLQCTGTVTGEKCKDLQTNSKICLTKVFYLTAFGFVGFLVFFTSWSGASCRLVRPSSSGR